MGIFVAYIFFTMTGLLLMKFSQEGIVFALENGSFNLHINITMIFALVMYGISFLLWTSLVVNNDLGFILPFSTAIVNVLSVTAGILLFDESMTPLKALGIALAVCGVVIMNLKS
ncbi:DMT family transporter [Peptococcus simiae]